MAGTTIPEEVVSDLGPLVGRISGAAGSSGGSTSFPLLVGVAVTGVSRRVGVAPSGPFGLLVRFASLALALWSLFASTLS